MKRNRARFFIALICMLAAGLVPAGRAEEAENVEVGKEARWYANVSLGQMDFEGDQDYKDAFVTLLRLGYDYSEPWSFEGVMTIAPGVDANTEIEPEPDWDSTTILGLAVDGLFHFTRWDRVDPYVAAGLGVMNYGEEPEEGDATDLQFRIGGGVLYHFNDEWAVRGDYRGMLSGFGESPNANSVLDAGVVWTWGARYPQEIVAVGASADTDADGLSDEREREIETDPFDPDTDNDELSDGEEVLTYETDPLNPDSDWDMLEDGAEVLKHETDPLKQDTDDGGVSDGHEVLEDDTDPLDGTDDLVLYTLHIEFDTDSANIKPRYFDDINIIGKVLTRNEDSTAVIEGHADKRKTSSAAYNKRLSLRRARAVKDYLVEKWEIAEGRLKAKGFGFERPMAPNDPETGNPKNRRVEVYIRGVDEEHEEVEKRSSAGAPAAELELVK